MGDLSKWRRTAANRTAANMPSLLADATTHANGQVITSGGLNITDQAKQYGAQQQTKAASAFAKAQNNAEAAQVEQQAVEDQIAENKQRNQVMSNIAFAAGQTPGGQLGRGTYRRRGGAVKISNALGSLAKVNAGELRAARLKTLKATQDADLTRTTPVLGYNLALSKIQGDTFRNFYN